MKNKSSHLENELLLNAKVKHSFYEAAKNAGVLRNGRPNRSAQDFGDLKKETNKNQCRKRCDIE